MCTSIPFHPRFLSLIPFFKKIQHNAIPISVLQVTYENHFSILPQKDFKGLFLILVNKQPILGRFKHSKISWSTHRPVEKQGSFSPCLFFTLNKPLHLLLVKSTLIFTSVHTFIHTPTLALVSETTESKIYRSGIILKTISHSVKNKIGIERIEKLRFVTTCGTCPYLSL